MVSKANLVRVVAHVDNVNASSGAGCAYADARGTTLIGLPQGILGNGAAGTGTAPVCFNILDKPGSRRPVIRSYGQVKVNAGFVTVPNGAVTGLGTYTQLEELMG